MPREPSSPEKTPRRLAVEILNEIETTGAFAEPLLDRRLSAGYLKNMADRRLLTELVYGALRMRGHLDWHIDRLFRGNPAAIETATRNILRTGLYQIFFTDRIPDFAIVDEAVKISGGSGLVNALLRNAIRQREKIAYPDLERNPAHHIAVIHSHPLWMVERWIRLFGRDETLLVCRANNEIPPVTVRVNRLKTSREKVIIDLERAGFKVRKTAYSSDGLVLEESPLPVRETDTFRQGHLQLQDEASQMISLLVDPQPGDRILDACAGAGGKAAHLAAEMGNRGSILAMDKSARKIGFLQDVTARLGVAIVDTAVADATAEFGEDLRESFDRILVDAPCSGLGTLRRNPEIKWRILPEDIMCFSRLQKAILERVAPCLRTGGVLAYSTCTVAPEENEEVIADFLARHGEFLRLALPGTIDQRLVDSEGFFRTCTFRHGMDGFFGAVLKKK